MPEYTARFLIEGKETTPAQHKAEQAARLTREAEFDEMTPREALEFIRKASEALGVTPQPKRYTGGAA